MRTVGSSTAVGYGERDLGRHRRRRPAAVAGGGSDPRPASPVEADGLPALRAAPAEARDAIRERLARRRELRYEVRGLRAELSRAAELEPQGTACREALEAALILASRLAVLIG